MQTNVHSINLTDEEGNPAGGGAQALGVTVLWQNGPMVTKHGERLPANGAFVANVIEIARQRIEFYQTTKFANERNATALGHLEAALDALNLRTAERKARGVEGSHKV